jgi:hypothetical protein
VPGQTLTTDAFVIERRPPTDSFQTFLLFSAEHGNLLALQRVPRKSSSTHVSPDLFDELTVMLESSNQGRSWFMKEVRVLTRRTGIGGSYDSLRFASALVAIVGRNPVHEESREAVGKLLRVALDSFAAGIRPDAVYLKSLYLFARDEGYPVKQEWLPSLGDSERVAAATVLNTKPAELSVSAGEVAGIRDSLEAYLESSTEIIIP